MPNQIFYFESADGECDVQEFLERLKKNSRKAFLKCLSYIDLLRDPGPPLHRGYAAPVQGRIWELRPEFGGTEYRFLYAQIGQGKFLILTGFKKDYQELRQQDIDRALTRLADYERRSKQ